MQGEWGEDRGLGSSSGSGACLHYERYVHHLRSILSLVKIFVSSDVTTANISNQKKWVCNRRIPTRTQHQSTACLKQQQSRSSSSSSSRVLAPAVRAWLWQVGRARRFKSWLEIFVSSDVTTKHRTKETGIYIPHPGQHQKPKPHQLRAENNSNHDALIWTYGPMDKAPVYGTGDSRFDPW